MAFAYFFDEKFRKTIANLAQYYQGISNEPEFKNVYGRPIMVKFALQIPKEKKVKKETAKKEAAKKAQEQKKWGYLWRFV